MASSFSQAILEYDRILTIHAGTAPTANQYVGADHFEPVMEAFPDMKVIVAHLGAYEFDRFLDMARRYPNLYLDTSVSFIDPGLVQDHIANGEFPPLDITTRVKTKDLEELADKILFGSDYPNIPWSYEECVKGITDLGLGDEFNRKVFFENARLLLGLEP